MTKFEAIETKRKIRVKRHRRLCPSCGYGSDRNTLRPYCSVVCRVLGVRGLGWRLNPYRIVDLESGIVVSGGPQFDVTRKGLEDLQIKAERLHQPATHPLVVDSAGPLTEQVPEQWPQPTFAGASPS